jgi:hypothetical protein
LHGRELVGADVEEDVPRGDGAQGREVKDELVPRQLAFRIGEVEQPMAALDDEVRRELGKGVVRRDVDEGVREFRVLSALIQVWWKRGSTWTGCKLRSEQQR